MISDYAIVDDTNLVINVVLWDGKNGWQPPENTTVVKVPAKTPVCPGWHYIDGTFVDDRPIVEGQKDAAN